MTKRISKRVIYNVRILSDIKASDYKGITVYSLGSLPGEDTVFFHYSAGGGEREAESVYISAVEALLSGYDIAYIPQLYLSSAVEKALEDTPRGSLFSFLPKGIATVSSSTLSRALVTGGGVLSIVESEAFYSFEALLGVTYLASTLSKAALMCHFRGRRIPSFVDSALSEGKSIAVLRSALKSRPMRDLVRDGAECVDSFSSFLASPRYMAYPSEKGSYGIESARWDIMRI